MGSLNERLGRLEERRAPPPWETPPLLTLLIKEMNAERLELDGRPPDPTNAPTAEEEEAGRVGAVWFLETGAALLRANSPASALENICAMEDDSTGPA